MSHPPETPPISSPGDAPVPSPVAPSGQVSIRRLLHHAIKFFLWLLVPPTASPERDSGTSRLDTLARTGHLLSLRRLGWVVMAFLGLFLVWASFARLDEVSVAPGEVAPQGKIKVIQHLEGGLVTDIYVREGETVREGAALMQLDLGNIAASRDEIEIRIDGLLLAKARLQAEANGSEPSFPKEVAGRRPQLVATETDTFIARRKELEATIRVLNEQMRQREGEQREMTVRQRNLTTNLGLARQRLGMSTSLLKDGLTAKMDHVQLQAEVEQISGELSSIEAALPRINASLAEAKGRVAETTLKFQREARELLGQTELDLARNTELLNKATEQQTRTEIRSPIEGIVKNMRISTIGGVVKPGEPIMDLVPSRDNLVIEARLNPMDRGYVSVGQPATIKISTYDYARYGGLKGKVILVAPDSTVVDGKPPYFRVVVEPEKYWLGETPDAYVISPGMEATVDIHTGTRSVLQYLVKPVLKLKNEAFRER